MDWYLLSFNFGFESVAHYSPELVIDSLTLVLYTISKNHLANFPMVVLNPRDEMQLILGVSIYIDTTIILCISYFF